MNKLSYRISILSLFIAFTLVLSYVELLIPISYGYGMKLGLANIAIVAVLYVFSFKDAFIVSIARIFISGLLFGNAISVIFSLCGGVLSIFIMLIVKKYTRFNIVSVSVIGAVFHNIGQIMAAYFITKVIGLFYYLPVLLIGAIVTGVIIGVLSNMIIKVLKEIIKDDRIFKG